MTTRGIIGLASGSSGDGVDAALLDVEGIGLDVQIKPLHAVHQPHPRDVRELLRQVSGPAPAEIKQVCLLHRLLGETFAAAARLVADRAGWSLPSVQCIGCPGHILWHEPEARFPSTLTLGMTAVVAERTGVTVVSDFGTRDLAAGGQAAPLSALIDYLLFRDHAESRLLLHLGSIARLVYLPARARIQDIVGFEVGPCTGLLDALMTHLTGGKEAYDPGGKHAVQGRCIEPLLNRWLGHPFLQRRPPKSVPRNGWGQTFAVQAVQQARQMNWSLHDLLCTATHFVAASIVQSIRRFLPVSGQRIHVLLSGGGVRNGLLWHLLEQQLPDTTLEKTDVLGIPTDLGKSLTSGILAALTLDGVPASVPSATGANGTRLLGNLTPGSPANWARCLSWMATLSQLPAAA
ncbi:MAG TPA: anhydro-N-acetylmuramic acid kinase [Gemmataceae bacterium]|nr:anhydro-N-acetylmuramic acid kinase [Gemmataceae bacterium]